MALSPAHSRGKPSSTVVPKGGALILACEKNIGNDIDIFFPTIVMVMTVKAYGARCGASVATVATGLAKCMCLG